MTRTKVADRVSSTACSRKKGTRLKPWLALMELLEPSVFFSIISKPDCLCYLLLLNMWAISSEKTVSSWMVRLYDFLLYLPVAKSNVINIIDPEVMLCVSSSLALIWRRLEDSGVFATFSSHGSFHFSAMLSTYKGIQVLLCTISFYLKKSCISYNWAFFQTFMYF